MKGVGLVGEVLPHDIYLGIPTLEDGESVGHVLQPLVAFSQGLLELLVAHLHADDLQLEVVLVLLQHDPLIKLVLGIFGLPKILLFELVVIISVYFGFDQLIPVNVVVQLHQLVLALAVNGGSASALRGDVPEAFVGCLLGSCVVMLFRSIVLVLLPKSKIACYWKMGL